MTTKNEYLLIPTTCYKRLAASNMADITGYLPFYPEIQHNTQKQIVTDSHSNLKENIMSKIKLIGALLFFVLAVQPAFADNAPAVQGLWKLISYEVESQATGQKDMVMGKNPTGYVIFTPEGRVFFTFTGDDRKPGKTDKEKADLLSSLVAYTGTYRIEGDKWITKVEVAWNPEWVGTEQTRNFTIDGDRLQILTPWRIMPNWADKGMSRSIVTLLRSK
jgi:hypothetical protein